MKRVAPRKILAIAAGPDGLLVVELANHKGRQELLRTLNFQNPGGVSLENPIALGRALQQELRRGRFAAREVIIGLPARWLVTRRRELPPMQSEMAAGVLRLWAEGEFGAEYKEMALDYAGSVNTGRASAVLLAGTSRLRVQQCQQLASAAGLRLLGVSSQGAAMAWAASQAGEAKSPVLSLSEAGAELVFQQDGIPTHLRHLQGGTGVNAESLSPELRRAMVGLPPLAEGASLIVWGRTLPDRSLHAELSKRLEIPLNELRPGALLEGLTDEASGFMPAISLAVAASRGAICLDFANSRLTPAHAVRSRRPLIWAAAVVGAIVMATVVAGLDLQRLRGEVKDLAGRLDGMASDISQAETAVARRKTVQGLTGGAPRFLACLSQLTQAFPEDGSVWLTSLSVRQNMTGQMSGKAAGEQQVLGLLDRLTASKRLTDLKLLEVRDAGRGVREVTFAISFTFKPAEVKL